MRLQIEGKQITVSPALQRLAKTRLEKLERLLNDSLVSAHLVLAREKGRHVSELTVHARGDHMMHGVGSAASWGPSLTAAVAKVARQAEKVKGKWAARKKG